MYDINYKNQIEDFCEIATEDDTFDKIVTKMVEKTTHRVFIVENHKPIGVVSMIDVIEFFWTHHQDQSNS